jgi:predicted nucleotidyltransferase
MLSLKSKITGAVLNYYFLNPEERRYVNELAGILNVDPGNLHRKLKEIEREGVLVGEKQGNQKYYFLNRKYPLLSELKKIFESEQGLPAMIEKKLSGLDGLWEGYIFGSYPKGRMNKESDIDILLIGSHSEFDAERRLLPLQKKLGRQINIVDMGRAEFEAAKKNRDPFIENVFSQKKIELALNV